WDRRLRTFARSAARSISARARRCADPGEAAVSFIALSLSEGWDGPGAPAPTTHRAPPRGTGALHDVSTQASPRPPPGTGVRANEAAKRDAGRAGGSSRHVGRRRRVRALQAGRGEARAGGAVGGEGAAPGAGAARGGGGGRGRGGGLGR